MNNILAKYKFDAFKVQINDFRYAIETPIKNLKSIGRFKLDIPSNICFENTVLCF